MGRPRGLFYLPRNRAQGISLRLKCVQARMVFCSCNNVPKMVHIDMRGVPLEKRIVARFYQSETGREYVRDWLLGLHTLIKKTPKTPSDDLSLARRRKKEV